MFKNVRIFFSATCSQTSPICSFRKPYRVEYHTK
jgi:hypothetical protein